MMMLINQETMISRCLGMGGLLSIMALTASNGPVVVRGVDVVDMVEREQDESCQSVMLSRPRHAVSEESAMRIQETAKMCVENNLEWGKP